VVKPSVQRVLVVDDNVDNADTLAALLRLLGRDVRCVTDARLAAAAALEFSPHVAFVDIGMPHINGYELARVLREKFGRELRLIALTGYGSAKDREMSRLVGFDAHLVKPADVETIDALLKRLFPPE
jgi:CheY-like chemotaxis protein